MQAETGAEISQELLNIADYGVAEVEFRPWGYFEVLRCGIGFKVKKLHVYPQSSLSLQRHRFRAEHWVVVRGEAEVICGAEKFRLPVNSSTFIPAGMIHQLANPAASEPLEIIEVQTGSYIGEDDIERLIP